MNLVLGLLFLLVLIAPARATVLEDTVAGMAPGTWAILTPGNISLLQGYENFAAYGDSGAWDSQRRKAFFCGSYHASTLRCVIYDEATHSYSALTTPPGYESPTFHLYDAVTIENNQYFYIKQQSSNDLWRYDIAAGTWTLQSTPFALARCCGALAHFPGFLGTGALIAINHTSDTMYYRLDGSSQWVSLGNPFMGETSWNWAQYNPVYGFMLFGNANGAVRRLNADGTFTNLNNLTVTIYDGGPGQVSVDPLTGRFIICQPTNRQCYNYDAVAQTTTALTSQPSSVVTTTGANLLQVPLPHLGVTLWLFCGSVAATCDGRLLIYKHLNQAEGSFLARCSAPGVVKCWSFDDSAGGINATNIRTACDGTTQGTLDTTQKASGVGSLRFRLRAGVACADIAGQWLPPAGASSATGGTNFGQGSTFYVSYRTRFSPEMFSNLNYWDSWWKNSIIHRDTTSCAGLEITQNHRNFTTPTDKLPNFYTRCGSGAHSIPATDPSTGNYKDAATLGPPYTQQEGDYFGLCNYNVWTNCWKYTENEWIEFYYKISVGTFDTANGSLEVWTSRPSLDGGARKKIKQVLNYPFTCNTDPCNQSPGSTQGFNNMTLTPYMTGLTQAAPVDAYVWYDELIISTQPIAAPLGAGGGGGGGGGSSGTTASGKVLFGGKAVIR